MLQLFTAVAVLVNAALVVNAAPKPTAQIPAIDCANVLCLQAVCKLGQIAKVPEGQCCPICVPDCSLIADCAQPLCQKGEELVTPEGACCPVCVPNTPDCSAVSCLLPVCKVGEKLVTPEGECCPQCVPSTPDCSAVSCLLPVCKVGEKLVTPEGECCPECVPTTPGPDCSAVLCASPICQPGQMSVVPEGECCPPCVPDCSTVLCAVPSFCQEGEELVTPEGQCCPVCRPVCEIKGQTFSTCASACPATCDDIGPKICPAVCIEGCTCPPGQVIDNVNKECVTPDECPDPCATMRCANGYQCEVYRPTGEAFCQPNCSLNNGGCSAGQECQLRPVQCVRAPCPPTIECTTDCPPTCTMEFCTQKKNRNKMCSNLNGPREIPGCTGPCQLTYCRTCYFDDELRSPPANCTSKQCEDLQDYLSDSKCFRRWGICVRRNQEFLPEGIQKTEENFRCHNPPCPLRG